MSGHNAFLGLPFHALLRSAVSARIGLYRCVCVCVNRVSVASQCAVSGKLTSIRETYLHTQTRGTGRPTYVRSTHVCTYIRATADVQEVGSQLHSRRHACRCKRFGRASIVRSSFRYPLSSTGRHCRRFSSKGNLLNVTFLLGRGLEDQERHLHP